MNNLSWNPISAPPFAEVGKRSRKVVAISKSGSAYTVSYFKDKDGGRWERPERLFKEGCELIMWIDFPETKGQRNEK